MKKVAGVIIPLITPFKDGKVDFKSYERLVNHLINQGVSGIIPLATTGEMPTISQDESQEIIEKTIEINDGRVNVYVGLGGNNTNEVIKKVKSIEKYNIDGILSVVPYYSRPSQEGIYQHFKGISEETNLDIIIYNIPYRTGVNAENNTIYRLAELENIVGIKDCCGDIKQTTDLLINRPKDFSILTGEDAFFYTTLLLGGDGGIMGSASLKTREFIEVYNLIRENNHQEALEKWRNLYNMIPLLFKEPNPTPIKYCLNRLGLIDSNEVRLPLVDITDSLKDELNKLDIFK
ncbi:4-hydroxy-tetrahydrodipicolinate synthase [Clostridium sp. SM-530-WT-3G]|uniref:4-hydroxy-tetrahydrodipicolinate synthase n=1 Tax=Clostridium sp. SM-530-WT-3G TaxID=2725303 RepID=UPI00145F007F|nr:4-hydroxy-tetrahydrodipicolinate synthase [Clostridium sp. SM-530-WT-3G]NME83884.1 4-hydroxy-tetrahydrodipicolinate synthase [Clostridium sp. SM-530-WT-3G]